MNRTGDNGVHRLYLYVLWKYSEYLSHVGEQDEPPVTGVGREEELYVLFL